MQKRQARLLKIFEKGDKDSSGALDAKEIANMIKAAFKKKEIEKLGDISLLQFAEMQAPTPNCPLISFLPPPSLLTALNPPLKSFLLFVFYIFL